jgi:ribonuclease III
MKVEVERFMVKIGYRFDDLKLLETALSHRSCGKDNNERLEFLGDSVVNFVTASELYKVFPEAKEGQLSRLRAHLIRGETLAEIAKEFELGLVLRLGSGESRSGGAGRGSILADALEAVIGAIYLDGGMEACYKCIANWYAERIKGLSLDNVHKDPKSLLQEYVQSKKLPLPEYELVTVAGEEHNQHFIIACRVSGLDHPITGEGSNRRKAEQQAAERVVQELANA